MTLDTSSPSSTIETQDSSHAGVYQVQIKAYLNTVPETGASASIDFEVALSLSPCVLTDFD